MFFLAYWFARYEKNSSHPIYGFVLPIAIILPLLGLILAEVDLGTTALIGDDRFRA